MYIIQPGSNSTQYICTKKKEYKKKLKDLGVIALGENLYQSGSLWTQVGMACQLRRGLYYIEIWSRDPRPWRFIRPNVPSPKKIKES